MGWSPWAHRAWPSVPDPDSADKRSLAHGGARRSSFPARFTVRKASSPTTVIPAES